MRWQDYIHTDPEILDGKPVIKGTRLSVEFLLGLLAVGWTEQQILDNYPTLKARDLQAMFAFMADSLQENLLFAVPEAV
jgi:uncharacterized protein (DUF433 family)